MYIAISELIINRMKRRRKREEAEKFIERKLSLISYEICFEMIIIWNGEIAW